MAANKPRSSSFSRISPSTVSLQTPGLKSGPNGTNFVSTGIADLDKILGGGFSLGSLVMIMEDAEAPHHMLIMRNFMSQGLVHNQSLLYVSPSSPVTQKHFWVHYQIWLHLKMRNPVIVAMIRNRKKDSGLLGNTGSISRKINKILALLWIQSKSTAMTLTCENHWKGSFLMDDLLTVLVFRILGTFLLSLIVVLLSYPRRQDDDKDLAALLTGYKDMVCFLNVNKVARINTQARVILEATAYSVKLQKRRTLILECLNQAPVDGASGSSYGKNTGSCSSKSGSLDF